MSTTRSRPQNERERDGKDIATIYRCTECGLPTLELKALKSHWIQKHGELGDEIGEFPGAHETPDARGGDE